MCVCLCVCMYTYIRMYVYIHPYVRNNVLTLHVYFRIYLEAGSHCYLCIDNGGIKLFAFELAAKFSMQGENPVRPFLCNA